MKLLGHLGRADGLAVDKQDRLLVVLRKTTPASTSWRAVASNQGRNGEAIGRDCRR